MEYEYNDLMHFEFNRLHSFRNVLFLNIVEKVDLARRNFYVRKNDFDNLVCYKCRMLVRNGCHEIPTEHFCIPKLNCLQNIPIKFPCVCPKKCKRAKHLLNIPEMRLASFGSWSYGSNNEMAYQVAELANAGFFYARKPYGVECYYCQQRITVYVCEISNCIDFQIPKNVPQVNCQHSKRLELLITRPNAYQSELGLVLKKFRKCTLCKKYKSHLSFRPYYHVESCDDCNQNLKALLSPSFLPSYKVGFNDRLSQWRATGCRNK